MFILKFLFFIFLLGVGVVLYFVLRIYLTVRQLKNRGGFHTENPSSHTTTTAGDEGERITVTRPPSHSQRKIIADDEGEYVEFEEEN